MNRALRDELIATSPLCAAIFKAWPDAVPRLVEHDECVLRARTTSTSEYGDRRGELPPAQSINNLLLVISWFPTGMPRGPAIGDTKAITWGNFVEIVCSSRREGEKDGPNFIPARFKLEPDGKHVRRLGANLIARTAAVMDCEANKQTGEVPPLFDQACARVLDAGWAGVLYTSHNHTAAAARYRIVLPLAEEIDHELPAVEVVAEKLALAGVIDRSKVGANSLFYLPSGNPGEIDRHRTAVIDGEPIDTAWLREAAGKLLTRRQAEQDKIAAQARMEAEQRRQAKIAAGFDPDDSLIEQIRAHLDLEHILLSHGYEKRHNKYRHPNSTSGVFGADIKAFARIERIYSHNANDPLHRDNLPDWCAGVTALDAFDVTVILDFGGNRTKALHVLGERYGLTKREERRTVARLIFKLLRKQAPQHDIEVAAFAEGDRLGLTRAQVCQVARWAISRTMAGQEI